ncbi:MAG: hypothetical protein V2J62_07120 [candidate division KSB1 bacterium]|jgi:hypothetical protein|nr:hypothetical protein [candidate division KSB1 bacterium]
MEVSYCQSLNVHGSVAGCESGVTLSPGVYKSYGSAFINLRRLDSTPIFRVEEESAVYRWLMPRLLSPRHLVFQATLYPLAYASSQLESFHRKTFDRFNFLDMNLLRTLGMGPEEPYAISFLFGNMALLGFRQKEEVSGVRLRQAGTMFAGLLLSGGHWHIHDNIRVDDLWYHGELIVTGNFKYATAAPQKIEWDFRLGTKIHRNDLAPDVLTFSLFRSHTDWNQHGFSLIRNARLEYEAHFPLSDKPGSRHFTSRQMFTYAKKVPLVLLGRYIALRLGGGVMWERTRLFDRDEWQFEVEESEHFTWLVQPSIEF